MNAPTAAPATPATAVPPPVSAKAIAVARKPNELIVFRNELNGRVDRFKPYLPDGVSLTKFIDTAISAVATNPSLLKCDRTSLHIAVLKAAKSGLMPDGRESCIVPRKGRAEWQYMVFGIRKRALELGGIILEANVVHENDEFDFELGDSPSIRHKPADPRKHQSRGALVACYCIVRKDGQVLHREVMFKADIDRVKTMVQAKDSLLWGKFESEGWRKSVVHRASKSVPLVPELAELFDAEGVDWAEEEAAAASEQRPADPLRDPELIDYAPWTDDEVIYEGLPQTNGQADMREVEYVS